MAHTQCVELKWHKFTARLVTLERFNSFLGIPRWTVQSGIWVLILKMLCRFLRVSRSRAIINFARVWLEKELQPTNVDMYNILCIYAAQEVRFHMDVITYTDARASLKDVMDRVIHDSVDVVVTRKKREAVVMMSLDEYNAIQETLHLQRSPENARRLQSSIAQLDASKGTEREIDL